MEGAAHSRTGQAVGDGRRGKGYRRIEDGGEHTWMTQIGVGGRKARGRGITLEKGEEA